MSQQEEIEIFKIRRLIQRLDAARGDGTSMISLYIPAGTGQLLRVNKMLSEESGKSANIKSRTNRLSVQSAITSIQHKLKHYQNRNPKNGLVIFCGTAMVNDEDNNGSGSSLRERKVNVDIEPPFRPINKSMYRCDNRFHTEPLLELLSERDDDVYGFIVLDGNGCLFGTVQGSNRSVLQKLSVDLPKKHGRGGQSALRFARLRLEKRHNYIVKVAELAPLHFLSSATNQPTVRGIILAGSADLKSQLMRTTNSFDPRLAKIVLRLVDLSYGGEQGFHQAIELSADTLSDVKLVKEKKLLQSFMDEIYRDTGKYCYSVHDTLRTLETGALQQLIVWDNLEVYRTEIRNATTGETTVVYQSGGNEADANSAIDEVTAGSEIMNRVNLVDWLAETYAGFGCNLDFVTDRSGEGAQFVQGFGGIGGILRWRMDLSCDDRDGDRQDDGNDSLGEESDSMETNRQQGQDEYDFDDGDFAF